MIAAALLLACLQTQDEPVILAVSPFYPGHVIGGKNKPDGLFKCLGVGDAWVPITWPELIASSVSVDSTGEWIYLAAGNGVLVSWDGGGFWKLTGGWQLSEVNRVFIDPKMPQRAWAASAYGLFATEDILAQGDVWKRRDTPFRYCSDVIVEGDTIIVGSETGIFRSEGRTFRRIGEDVAIRRLRRVGSQLYAATDGAGLFESGDEGRSWKRVDGSPSVCYTVESAEGALWCGSISGVHIRRNGAWIARRVGTTDSPLIYSLCFPKPGRALASGKAGIFESLDGGATWRGAGLAGAIVTDLWSGRIHMTGRPPGNPDPKILVHPRGSDATDPADPEFTGRQQQLRRRFAETMKERTDVFGAIVRSRDGTTDDALWAALRKHFDEPGTTMFFSLPAMALYLQVGEALPVDLQDKIHRALTGTPFYRGDTENHWVMHYTAQLLIAQTWPDTPRWPSGQSTRELYDEARGWLQHWTHLTATRGQGEFDSPGYLFMFMTPMLLLRDFAKEDELRQEAGMTLDLLLADYFSESLAGAWCGGHSRVTSMEVRRGADNVVSAYHYLYAGGIDIPRDLHPWVVPACYANYRPPALLATIANRRDVPFTQRERKRTRNILRYSDEMNAPVYKSTYLTRDFGLGSLQGGILQPIQQHTWGVTWKSGAPNPTLFSVHPWASGRELSMFFGGDPNYLVEIVRSGKGDYTSPDKWVSSSPYERVAQREDMLIALYDVPETEMHPHVNLYWPACLTRTLEKGWYIGRDGRFFAAVHPLRPDGEWSEIDGASRFRCPGQKNGFIVVAGPRGDETFEHFSSMVLALHVPTYEEADADFWIVPTRLYDGPFMSADVDSGVITLTDGVTERILDFNRVRVTERPRGGTRAPALLAAVIIGGSLLALLASRRR